MSAYRWLERFVLKAQYRDLLLHWVGLCRHPDVHQHVLCKRETRGEQPAGVVAAGFDQEPPTGKLEHGADIIKPGLEFQYVFQWGHILGIVHTGRLPSGAVLELVLDA